MSAILKEEPAELLEAGRTVPPALERMVRHCVEKNPAQRFSQRGSGVQSGVADGRCGGEPNERADGDCGWKLVHNDSTEEGCCGGQMASTGGRTGAGGFDAGRGLVVGTRQRKASAGAVSTVTFRSGSIGNERFTPTAFVYSASWDGGDNQLYVGRTDDPGGARTGLKNAASCVDFEERRVAVRLTRKLAGGCKRNAGAGSD